MVFGAQNLFILFFAAPKNEISFLWNNFMVPLLSELSIPSTL